MTQTPLSLLWTHYRSLSLPKVIKFPPQEPEIKSIPAFTTFFLGLDFLWHCIESSPSSSCPERQDLLSFFGQN